MLGPAAAALGVVIHAVAIDLLALKQHKSALVAIAAAHTVSLIALHRVSAHTYATIAAIGPVLVRHFAHAAASHTEHAALIIGFAGVIAAGSLDCNFAAAVPTPLPLCTNVPAELTLWTVLVIAALIGTVNVVRFNPATRPSVGTKAAAVLSSIASAVMVTTQALHASRHNHIASYAQLLAFTIFDTFLAHVNVHINSAKVHAPAVYFGWACGTIAADAIVLKLAPRISALCVQCGTATIAVTLLLQ